MISLVYLKISLLSRNFFAQSYDRFKMLEYKMGSCNMIVLILSVVFTAVTSEYLPVFMWEAGKVYNENSALPPSLAKVSSSQFADYFKKRISNSPFTVLFLEENLSLEDFRPLGKQDQNTFTHLQNISSFSSNVQFFPGVENPLRTLKKLGIKWNELDDEAAKGSNFVLVKLSDAQSVEDRPDFLERHDAMINDIFSQLVSEHTNVLALYTGRFSSWTEPDSQPHVRKIREASGNETFWHASNRDGPGVLLYSSQPPIINYTSGGANITTALVNPQIITVDIRSGYMSLFVRFSDFTIKFRFNGSENLFWNLDNVEFSTRPTNETVSLKATKKLDMTVPYNFSYSCAATITFVGGGPASPSLTFYGLQVQAYQTPEKIAMNYFDDSYDCVPFFSVPIWSGLFITIMLGFILVWGLMNLMDIKTMDQFDDPKGKTITISATE